MTRTFLAFAALTLLTVGAAHAQTNADAFPTSSGETATLNDTMPPPAGENLGMEAANSMTPEPAALAPVDGNYLDTLEAWQRRIAIQTLALRARELDVQQAEQDQRLEEIRNPSTANTAAAPANMQSMLDSLAAQTPQVPANITPARPEITVRSIRGVGDALTAIVETDSGARVMVRAGDSLPNGEVVDSIRPSSLTIGGKNYGLTGG